MPYSYLGKKVDVWYSLNAVNISYQGEVIATHPKLSQGYQDSTLIEHMPASHQYQYEKWNPGRILNWAKDIGEQYCDTDEKYYAEPITSCSRIQVLYGNTELL